MSSELQVIEQRSVNFYGDELLAARVAAGTVYVPIRPICDLLGIDWNGQRRRINRDPVLAAEATSVDVTSTQGDHDQRRAMICLPLKYIPGFLFGINATRVSPDIQERLIRYQRECYDVLYEAFREDRLAVDPAFEELLTTETPAVQAYRMIVAMAQMARQQILLESRVDSHEMRIEALEAKVSDPERLISAEQAMHISQAVKAIAVKLGERSGRNEFQGVYGEFYRRFQIPSYRQLAANRFEEAMGFLTQWYQSLTGDALPF